jgi:hypothetical protein
VACEIRGGRGEVMLRGDDFFFILEVSADGDQEKEIALLRNMPKSATVIARTAEIFASCTFRATRYFKINSE